jgi:transcriptional regulator with XRE-family HTH domain
MTREELDRLKTIDDRTINVDTIGQTIRKLRQERGMTLQELTDRSGVAMSSIVTIEAGRRKAGGTVDTLLRLLDALGMECVIRIADVEDIYAGGGDRDA